ncbi:MAG: hypothetical protein ABFS23_08980 [Pseudomonadota bacterium]
MTAISPRVSFHPIELGKAAMRRFLLLVLLLPSVAAAISLTLSSDRLTHDWLEAGGLELALDLSGPEPAVSLRAQELQLAGIRLNDLAFVCPRPEVRLPGRLACDQGKLSFRNEDFSAVELPLSFEWTRAASADDGWQLNAAVDAIDLGDLGTALGSLWPQAGVLAGGQSRVALKLDYRSAGVFSGSLESRVADVSLASADAAVLGESLDADIKSFFASTDRGLSGTLEFTSGAGELLTPYFYLSTTDRPLKIRARFDADLTDHSIVLEGARLTHGDLLSLRGSARILPAAATPLSRLRLSSGETSLAAAVENYLEPVLVHPLWESLQASGGARFTLALADGRLAAASLGLNAVSATAGDPPVLSVTGLDADLATRHRDGRPSVLAWQSASLRRVELGTTELALDLAPSSIRLLRQAVIPVFDGQLEVDRFSLDWRKEEPEVLFDAILLPISMERITEALDWVPMGGYLSGVIPGVSLRDGSLNVDGTLLIRVFDGEAVVRNLHVRRLLGDWPVLTADLECRNLDLEQITGAYDFGRITGRLEGEVRSLRVENWKPVAFDARFATPPGDKSRRRISQRAIDNITSLSGSGMSGVLSRTFLRFFDDFGYSRLGVSCRLEKGVCQMSGLEPANGGYYLVKGGGIPRIDVIGFNNATDWELLVDRLINISESGPPVIE